MGKIFACDICVFPLLGMFGTEGKQPSWYLAIWTGEGYLVMIVSLWRCCPMPPLVHEEKSLARLLCARLFIVPAKMGAWGG